MNRGSFQSRLMGIMQMELGSLDFPSDQNYQKFRSTMSQDKGAVWRHCSRVLRCIVDCQQELQDSTAVLNGLQLVRCLEGKCWENAPGELRQLDGIGPASVRKFVNSNIRSISKLVTLQPHQIETTLSRNPPFGTNVLKAAKAIPQFKLSSKSIGTPKVGVLVSGISSRLPDRRQKISARQPLEIRVQTTLVLENGGTVPRRWRGAEMIAVFVAERSDGFLVDMQRLAYVVSKLSPERKC
jgi:ATP-dependent DNA helicase HFM1/MER3